jgi:hypothetical protein
VVAVVAVVAYKADMLKLELEVVRRWSWVVVVVDAVDERQRSELMAFLPPRRLP